MHEIEKYIADFLKGYSGKFIVACSGGLDSMVLLNLVLRVKRDVSVAHVNYQLRAEDSENDEKHIASFCKKNNLLFHLKRVDLKTRLEKEGGNLQEEARNIRYSFFSELITDHNTHILLAHHADDQVETFFLNLSRNAGVMGLSSMVSENANYLRPLLPFSKEQLHTYAIENTISWREDSSNSSSYYNRNKLRNIILPDLYLTIPSLKESVLTMIQTFQNTQKSMEQRVKERVEQVVKNNLLPFSHYDTMNEFEFREFLRSLRIPQSFYTEFSKLRHAEKSKHIMLKKSFCASVINQGDYFEFVYEKDSFQLPIVSIVTVYTLPPSFDKSTVYLNPDNIKGTLRIRRWKIGDRIKPIGINGSKRISQILKDAHIPIHVRKNQLVVEDDEKIIWCVGLAVGREAVADNQSKILRVSVKAENL